MKLHLEPLESRDTPTAFVGLNGDTLAIVLVGNDPHAAVLADVGDRVQVTADFGTWAFPKASVKAVVVIGSPDSSNFIADNLDLPAMILGGSKSDAILTTGAKALVFGGGGQDFFAVQPVDPPAITTPTAAAIPPPVDAATNAAYAAMVFSSPSQFTDLFGPPMP